MKRLQKAAALVLALVVVFSASVVPAHAEEYVSRADIFSWIASQGKIGSIISQITGVGCPINEDGRHVAHSAVFDGVAGHYVCTCDSCGDTFIATKSELHDAYDSHVDNMPVNGVDSAGGFYWYPSVTDIVNVNFTPVSNTLIYIDDSVVFPLTGTNSSNSNNYFNYEVGLIDSGFRYVLTPYGQNSRLYPNNTPSFYCSWQFEAPLNGTYLVEGGYSHSSGKLTKENGDILTKDIIYKSSQLGHKNKDDYVYIGYNELQSPSAGSSYSYYTYFSGEFYFPVLSVVPDEVPDTTFFTPDTRPGTITGKYLVQNGDAYEDSSTTIINEDDNSIYNPVTNTTTNYDSWSYDYSTRTYTMTDNTNNSVSTVTYGDENITINEGGNTYNVYYGTVINNNGGDDSGNGGNGGGGGGGSDSGSSGDTGIIAKLGEMLGTLVSGLLGGVTAFVSAVFDGLISLANVISDKFGQVVSAVLSWFAQIPELFAGFSAFLVAVFPFLPADVMLLLTFGLAAVVFIAIIKAIRR